MSSTLIHVRFDAPGFHRWPDAPPHRSYLAQRHRHLFKVEVTTSVNHDEREIEFHDLLDAARHEFTLIVAAGGNPKSCEAMARALHTNLSATYKRMFSVSVWEDGECGATVTDGVL